MTAFRRAIALCRVALPCLVALAGCRTTPTSTGLAPPAPAVAPAAPIVSTGSVIQTSATVPVQGPQGAAPAGPVQPVAIAPASPSLDNIKEKEGFDWSDLDPENVWKKVKKASGYGPDEKIARNEFQEAEALFRQKKYAEAAPKFYVASWRWPDTPFEEDAMFLLGECYFFSDQYSLAYDAYTNLLKKYDNTRYLDTVMSRVFHIGCFWEELELKNPHWPVRPNMTDKTQPWFDTFGNALGAFEMVRLHDPTGPLAEYAIIRTADAHFRREHYEEAAYHYDLLRKNYPKSRFQLKAHLLGLQSKLKTYQGAMYDLGPLNDAEEIANQTLTQFRNQLGDERDRLLRTRGEIILAKTERIWEMGQFYENKRCYGASKGYYRDLVTKYPQTPRGAQARQRLEEIRNYPDGPPNYFPALTRLFEREQ